MSRYETYLRKIAGEDVDISNMPVPSDRYEYYLKQIAENGAGADPEAIAEAVTDWLDDHVDPETGYVIDNTLLVEGAAADAKKVGDEIADLKSAINVLEPTATSADVGKTLVAKTVENGKVTEYEFGEAGSGEVKPDGYYQQMTVGNAEQLVATVGIEDKVPYNFRTSGGSADIGDREVDKLIGGTVAWNQLVKNGNFADTSEWTASYGSISVSGNVCTYTVATSSTSARIQQNISVVAGHKYFLTFDAKPDKGSEMALRIENNSDGKRTSVSANAWSTVQNILSVTTAGAVAYLYVDMLEAVLEVGDNVQIKNVMIIDLTQMFGSTIADYIYSLETATDGAGVAYFRKLFPKPYYAYNAGELMHVQTSGHKMVGFNAYDNSTGVAKVLGGMEYQITGSYTALSLDGETVTPDADGYFTPSHVGTLTVTGGNATDTCVHLVWDGERDGEYEPYTARTYPLDSDLVLRGIPKLDASNNLYYDGDEYADDGTVTRKYGIRAYQEGDSTDGSTMITDGTNTVYKLTTPTTETADPYTNPQIVDDFGTEEYIDTRTIPIPVGHDTMYRANLRAKLEMAPDSPDGDGDYIVRQTNGQNEYVLHEHELPTAPTTDGTYHLKLTVSGTTKTLTWEADT